MVRLVFNPINILIIIVLSVSLVYTIVFPLGYILILSIWGVNLKLHCLTALGLSVWLLFFYELLYKKMPFWRCILLSGVCCLIGYQAYNSLWDLYFDWWFPLRELFLPGTFIRMILYLVVFVVIIKLKVHNLKMSLKVFSFLLVLNFLMLGWLESTNFFVDYMKYMMTARLDPHNFVWFIGKLLSFLVYPAAFLDWGQIRNSLVKKNTVSEDVGFDGKA